MMMRTLARILLIEAIDGRTLPCDIRDSEIATYDTGSVPERDLPFCAVYTDTDEELTLVLGVTLAAAKTVQPETDGAFAQPLIEAGLPGQSSSLPPTDLGLEMTIDALEYQIKQALKAPDNSWADLLKRGTNISIDNVRSARGTLRSKNGRERLAGREVRFPIDMLPDLDVGVVQPDHGFWADAFELLQTSSVYSTFIENYQRMLASRSFDDLQQIIAQVNLNTASMRALGQAEVPTDT